MGVWRSDGSPKDVAEIEDRRIYKGVLIIHCDQKVIRKCQDLGLTAISYIDAYRQYVPVTSNCCSSNEHTRCRDDSKVKRDWLLILTEAAAASSNSV
jgi:hypothetical protein